MCSLNANWCTQCINSIKFNLSLHMLSVKLKQQKVYYRVHFTK